MDCETLIIIGIASIIIIYCYKKYCDRNNFERFVMSSANGPPINNSQPSSQHKSSNNDSPHNDSPHNDPQMNWNTTSDSTNQPSSVYAAEPDTQEVNPRINLSRSTCYPQTKLTAEDLLPKNTQVSDFVNNNPSAEGVLKNINFLTAGYNIGVNTVGQTLRNANLQLRSEPPNPQVSVSPWLQSTIAPDILRKPFEIDEKCTL